MANENILTITNSNFEEQVKNSDVPVLVDFWASWCGPCKMIAPVIDELADDFVGKAKIAKINVDEQRELASTFSIMSIPTILIFKDGEVAEKVVGARSKQDLAAMIEKNM